MLVEIAGEELYFQAVSRTGRRSTAAACRTTIDEPPLGDDA
jgi:hypothetical protein